MRRPFSFPERGLSICEITTKHLTFDQDVYAYKGAGIEGISLWWDKLLDFGISKGARLLRETGLPAVSLVGGPFLLGSPETSRRAAFDELCLQLDACAQFGAGVLGVVPGNCAGRSLREMEDSTVEVLIRLGEEAQKRDVILALEPIHAPYFDFLNTLVDADRIVQSVNSPNVGIMFDTWHLCHEADLDRRVEETAARIALVHFSDWREPTRYHDDRLLPGDGILPLGAILRKLHSSGYRGYYDVEVFSQDVWSADQADNLRKCRTFFDSVWTEQPK